ncbi:MAG: hypothetical protein CO012_02115 [Syntrophobacterales bacterium CG_4_8_14_3_um_filter_49_14]|nr:MAG: hypothetical protein COX52_03540 [Syntrophobacterales bacterium CG23_combo_of_CG06-09_8_20_14_all_48_27]PJA49733.1 MAG: hypothetical protein CO171_04405 [Syntrophobacterales bacterium CG_4_9_14_3_um_filter_49_8]PJC75818.1 MAG: hypothetical protein CO012_02115 [Syntrophobacterales bacterium CG_4_8_14_3_um_filter_49_14]
MYACWNLLMIKKTHNAEETERGLFATRAPRRANPLGISIESVQY